MNNIQVDQVLESIDWQSCESISAGVLEIMPQQTPFRYIDKIVEIDREKIVGQYTFKEDEYFYQGHFPGKPTTPGVILIETMAQTAVVAFGIYLSLLERQKDPNYDLDGFLTFFTDVEAEFSKMVEPSTTVTIKAEKLFWRRRKLKCKASLVLSNGDVAAAATLAGVGVKV